MGELQRLVGLSVRRLRMERGLTQSQLAEMVGRSIDLISRLERGDTAPSFTTLESLCDALRVGAPELFGGPPENPGSRDVALERLIETASPMTADELNWLVRLVEIARERPEGS